MNDCMNFYYGGFYYMNELLGVIDNDFYYTYESSLNDSKGL